MNGATNNTLSFTITETRRGPKTRSVKLRLDNVAGAREIELTSFEGRPVEVYVEDVSCGVFMYQGTIAAYAPVNRANNAITATFAKAWFGEQKSKAARIAFETSARYA